MGTLLKGDVKYPNGTQPMSEMSLNTVVQATDLWRLAQIDLWHGAQII